MTEGRGAFLLRLAGWAIALSSVVFVVLVASRRWAEISAIRLDPGQWALVAGLALAYGLALFLLAFAWHLLLRMVGAAPSTPARSVHAYATSQLAKYVPGNVFHYVGRHMLLRDEGVSDRRLALATLIEAGLMLTGAGVVVLLAVAVEPPRAVQPVVAGLGTLRPFVLGLAAAVGTAAALIVAIRLTGGRVVQAAGALAAYCLFFALMGAMLAAIAAMVASPAPFAMAGGGVAAWMAGFVTPGAPAGFGTREAAMLLFAKGQVPSAALIVAAALFRVVTLAGDLVCFAVGQLLFRKS